MRAWLAAFVFTQLVEVPIYLAASRGTPAGWPRRLGVAFGASLLTHPLVWFGFPRLPLPYWPMVGLAEVSAVVAEALWLRVCGGRHTAAWSLLANSASLTLGLAARAWLGWP